MFMEKEEGDRTVSR